LSARTTPPGARHGFTTFSFYVEKYCRQEIGEQVNERIAVVYVAKARSAGNFLQKQNCMFPEM